MNVLDEVLAAVDPAVAAHAARKPGQSRFTGAGLAPGRELVLEAVYEGYLLHYGEPRLFAGMDDDLRLLAGDALYALGLSKLAEAGDLPAVAELSRLISASAQVHAEDRPEAAEPLWDASARALAA